MTTSTPEKADGLKALENAIEKIRETIKKLGGVFNVNMAVSTPLFASIEMHVFGSIDRFIRFGFLFRQPKVVTATDEADLARRMERAELENAEIDGDVEGESDDDDEGLKFDEEGNAASSEEEDAKN